MPLERQNIWMITIFVATVLALITTVSLMYQDMTNGSQPAICTDFPSKEVYEKCLSDETDKFFKIDYSETKDLAKAFLTLLVAVFVASVTFSEKIADLKTAGLWAKSAMITCWVLLLLAISACGAGLTYMIFGLGTIIHEFRSPYPLEHRAQRLFGGAGLLFGLALISMLFAGLPATFKTTEAVPIAARGSEDEMDVPES